jgi:hypothetical protein
LIISGLTREDLEACRDVASRTLGNELLFTELESYSAKRHRVRLQVADIDGPSARRHSLAYMYGHSKRPRRSRFACGHSYGIFFVCVYERNQYARIHTAFAAYRDCWHFLGTYQDALDRNIGSMMCPLRLGDECTCESDDIYSDTLEAGRVRPPGVAELPSTSNTATVGVSP